MKFAKGNEYSRQGGLARRGTRNKLAADVFRDVLAHWNELVKPDGPPGTLTKGQAALQMLFRESPRDYVRSVFSVLPKEFVFENVVSELCDEELDRMIEQFRERALAAREEKALEAPKMKVIEHAVN
jgi:hypothetical protein